MSATEVMMPKATIGLFLDPKAAFSNNDNPALRRFLSLARAQAKQRKRVTASHQRDLPAVQ
jgi:hypothetical protein